jgi:predicted RNA-binding Zn-ribbon protein involved in translation (DUF1610 family)
MIEMKCPGCGAKLKASDRAAGRTLACPKCGMSVNVAEPVYEAEEIPDDPVQLPDDAYGVDEPAPLSAGPGAAGGDRRPCPMCGEMILASAAKCRYCGEIFDPALKKAEALKGGGAANVADADMTTGDWFVAILCSGIGCILGIVWMIQGKPKGKKMFAVSFVVNIVFGVIRVLIEQANQK